VGTILDPSKKLATDKGRKVIDDHFLRPDFWGDIRRGKLMVKKKYVESVASLFVNHSWLRLLDPFLGGK